MVAERFVCRRRKIEKFFGDIKNENIDMSSNK